MTDLNMVCLMGRATKDATYSTTQAGMGICKFSMAVNKSRKVGDQWQDEASFFDVIVFGDRAERISQKVARGTKLTIQGELRQRRWEKDGQKYSCVEIIATSVYTCDTKETTNETQKKAVNEQRPNQPKGPESFEEAPSFDDIPF